MIKVALSLSLLFTSLASRAAEPGCATALTERASLVTPNERRVMGTIAKLTAARMVALGLGFVACTARAQDNLNLSAPPVSCAARPTDVVGSLATWRDAWAVAERNWGVSVGENSGRSSYEIYSRYNGLAFVLGVGPKDMMDFLRVVGQEGPRVQRNWNWEDYARMGEAAIIRNKPIVEAVEYMKEVYELSRHVWNYLDYSRAAAAGFIAGAPPRDVVKMLSETYKISRGWWTNGTFSRVAEGALIAGVSAPVAIQMLDDVYRIANQITPYWNDDDYARVARAAMIMNIPAEKAVRVLAETYRETIKISSGWHYRDYSRMASAAIITQKSPREAAQTLKETWDNRAISPNWGYADYSTAAAAALIGRGTNPDAQCPAYYKVW